MEVKGRERSRDRQRTEAGPSLKRKMARVLWGHAELGDRKSQGEGPGALEKGGPRLEERVRLRGKKEESGEGIRDTRWKGDPRAKGAPSNTPSQARREQSGYLERALCPGHSSRSD